VPGSRISVRVILGTERKGSEPNGFPICVFLPWYGSAVTGWTTLSDATPFAEARSSEVHQSGGPGKAVRLDVANMAVM